MAETPTPNQVDPASSVQSAEPGQPEPRKVRSVEEIHENTKAPLAALGCRWLIGSPELRVAKSPEDSLHAWDVFAGDHVAEDSIEVQQGDSVVVVGNDQVTWQRGPAKASSRVFAVRVRGVSPSDRSVSLVGPSGTRPLFPHEHQGVPKVFVVDIRAGETAGIPGGPVAIHCLKGTGQFVVGPDHDPLGEVPMRVNDSFASFQDNQLAVRAFERTRLVVVHLPSANAVHPRG